MVTLEELAGTHWTGKAELWLDPSGDSADLSDCTLAVESGAIRYTWSHDGTAHTGSVTLLLFGRVAALYAAPHL